MAWQCSDSWVFLLVKQADINHSGRTMCLKLLAQQEEVIHAAVGPGSGLEFASPTTQAHSMQAVLGDVDLLQGWQVEQKEASFSVNLHTCVVAHVQPLQIGCSWQGRWYPAATDTDEQCISATWAVDADPKSKYPTATFSWSSTMIAETRWGQEDEYAGIHGAVESLENRALQPTDDAALASSCWPVEVTPWQVQIFQIG